MKVLCILQLEYMEKLIYQYLSMIVESLWREWALSEFSSEWSSIRQNEMRRI